ncbi:MAG: tetratricopeptide repeat protein, partial [Chloroflexi bacterium]|nr:tetratricopeptide repeat protein [Chloroflexota bacterium]
MTLVGRVVLLLLVAGLPCGCRLAGHDQAAEKAPEAALSAQEWLAQRRGAEAAWDYQEVLARRPGDASARVGLAAALGLLRLMELAIPLLEELLEQEAPPVDARRALAELYLVTGRPEEAKAVLAADPAVRQSRPALLSLGRSCLAVPRPDEAREAFLAYRRLEPESAEADYWLGEAHWAAGRAEEARRHWRQGAQRAP